MIPVLNEFMRRFGNFRNMMSQFNQFRNTFQGDPRQQVQQLLDSGRMTQQQFNDLQAAARQIQNMMRSWRYGFHKYIFRRFRRRRRGH